MRLKEGFITHDLMGEQLMVAVGDSAEQKFRGMVRSNETATFVIDCLKKETTKEELLGQMLQVYEVDEKTAMRAIMYVLENLRHIGALDEKE